MQMRISARLLHPAATRTLNLWRSCSRTRASSSVEVLMSGADFVGIYMGKKSEREGDGERESCEQAGEVNFGRGQRSPLATF